MIEMKRIQKWSKNTKQNHGMRGLPIKVPRSQILGMAIDVLLENSGCCPECGRPFEFGTDHWISLEYVNPTEFEIICMDCNVQRAIKDQRKGFTYLNSK